jgi:hypothetical protein
MMKNSRKGFIKISGRCYFKRLLIKKIFNPKRVPSFLLAFCHAGKIFQIIFVTNWLMRKIYCLSVFLLLLLSASAQQVVDLKEGTPYESNGIEYGFYITNEGSKEVKGDDYERYEVNLYVTNKSGCLKLIPFKNGWTGNNSGSNSDDGVMIAEFNCTNATGKRMTAKKGTVSAKAFYTNVRIPDETAKDKYRTVNALIGYALRNGQTITNKIIVILPKGERPKMNCRTVYIQEMQ